MEGLMKRREKLSDVMASYEKQIELDFEAVNENVMKPFSSSLGAFAGLLLSLLAVLLSNRISLCCYQSAKISRTQLTSNIRKAFPWTTYSKKLWMFMCPALVFAFLHLSSMGDFTVSFCSGDQEKIRNFPRNNMGRIIVGGLWRLARKYSPISNAWATCIVFNGCLTFVFAAAEKIFIQAVSSPSTEHEDTLMALVFLDILLIKECMFEQHCNQTVRVDCLRKSKSRSINETLKKRTKYRSTTV